MQQAQPIITWTLLALGAGFLVANAKLLFEYIQFVKRRRAALLTWQPPKPPYYGMAIAIGVSLGILVVAKVLVHRQMFGEMMMFVYYACLTPLSRRIGRGFYEDGIWADSSFIPFNEIGGLTWVLEPYLSLDVVSTGTRTSESICKHSTGKPMLFT